MNDKVECIVGCYKNEELIFLPLSANEKLRSIRHWIASWLCLRSILCQSYNFIWFFCFIDSLLDFHELSLLFTNNIHAGIDFTTELSHGRFNIRKVIAIHIHLTVELFSFCFEPFNIWMKSVVLMRSFWNTCSDW